MIKILQSLYKRVPVQNPNRLRGRRLQALRQYVFSQALYQCAECHRVTAELELDHRVSLANGGTDNLSNLQALCLTCHVDKTNRERELRNR